MVQIWTLICALYSWLNLFFFNTDLPCDHSTVSDTGYHSQIQLASFRCCLAGFLPSRLLPCCLCCSTLLLAPPYLWNSGLSLLPYNQPRYMPILQDCTTASWALTCWPQPALHTLCNPPIQYFCFLSTKLLWDIMSKAFLKLSSIAFSVLPLPPGGNQISQTCLVLKNHTDCS